MGSLGRSDRRQVHRSPLRATALVVLLATACQLGGLVGVRDKEPEDDGGPPSPPASSTPAAIRANSGNGQQGVVGEDLVQPYAVRVTNAAGAPIASVEVRWASVSGGGSVSPTSGVTDANGEARAVHRLGTVAGDQRVRATVSGASSLTAEFESTARAGALDEVVLESDASDVAVAEAMSPAVRVVLRDRFGNVADHVTGTATASITPGTGPALAILAGTVEVSVQQGRAQFNDLRLGVPGSGYRLRLAASGRAVDTQFFSVTLLGLR
jgi:hypothetical protein